MYLHILVYGDNNLNVFVSDKSLSHEEALCYTLLAGLCRTWDMSERRALAFGLGISDERIQEVRNLFEELYPRSKHLALQLEEKPVGVELASEEILKEALRIIHEAQGEFCGEIQEDSSRIACELCGTECEMEEIIECARCGRRVCPDCSMEEIKQNSCYRMICSKCWELLDGGE